jgi:uncharacterized membrane protein
MFIYNRLTELTILQSLPVLVLLLLGLILGIILLKDKPTLKLILISLVLGILVSLVSGLVGCGSYSGTGYAERFGWPLQYFNEYRFYEVGVSTTPVVPLDFRFDLLRFCVNSSIYVISFINILWFFSIRKNQKNLSVHVLLLFSLFAILILSILSLNNKNMIGIVKNQINVEDDTEQKFEPRARYVIESKYPEFKDFEKQSSFAGKEVITKMSGTILYFAYVVNGSGVRYADATCFSVDENFNIREIGKLNPNSSTNKSIINPVTCKVN